MRAEYQATSDRNRAALQAQLLQQGFGQAQTSCSTTSILVNQQALANQQATVSSTTIRFRSGCFRFR
jgi:hypothetical protein